MKQLSKYTITNLNQLSSILKSYKRSETTFLCIGNPIMSDDGIGCYIFNNLSNLNGIKLINTENVPENYVSKIIKLKPKLLIGIDAVEFSSYPGEIKLFNEGEILNFSSSTHSISLKMIIDRIREELDFSFYLVGIQPKNIMLSNDFSEEVLNSANMLIRLIKSLYT